MLRVRGLAILLVAAAPLVGCLEPPYSFAQAQKGAGGIVAWAKRFGDPGEQRVEAIAVTADGDVVIAGEALGTVAELGLSIAADRVSFVAKLSPAGEARWARVFHSSDGSQVRSLAVSPTTGAIAIGGEFTGILGSENGSTPGPGDPIGDGFIALVDARGELQWMRRIGGPDHQAVEALTFWQRTADHQAVAAVGYFAGPLCLDLAGAQTCFATPTGSDAFFLNIDADGQQSDPLVLGGTGDQRATALAFDGKNLLVAGTNTGSMTAGLSGVTLATHGSSDIFLYELGPDMQYAAGFGDHEPNCYPWCEVAVAVDSQHGVLFTGTINGTLDLGKGAHFANPLFPDTFVTRYEPTVAPPPGALSWLRILGGPGNEVRPYAIASRLGTHVAMAGLFRGDFDAGFGVWHGNHAAHDVWLAGFDAGGTPEWGTHLGSDFAADDPQPPPPPSLAVGPAGEVYAAGSFRGRLHVGNAELASAGDYDFFVIKLTP